MPLKSLRACFYRSARPCRGGFSICGRRGVDVCPWRDRVSSPVTAQTCSWAVLLLCICAYRLYILLDLYPCITLPCNVDQVTLRAAAAVAAMTQCSGDSRDGGGGCAERYRHRGFSATERDLISERMASWDLDQGARFSSLHSQSDGDGTDARRVGGGGGSGSVPVVPGCRAAAC